MITDIRVLSQQLTNPLFDNPKDLVSWMGAIQAQNYNMAKWAIGIRTKNATLKSVDEALEKGEIVRTHIMRPTWHFVAPEDIRWMLGLTGKRVGTAIKSWYGKHGISDELYNKYLKRLEKILEGSKGLSKQEIIEKLTEKDLNVDVKILEGVIGIAESEAIICSGVDKAGKNTYTLLEERVPSVSKLTKEESLALLATKYFRSHSPASLEDFTWWSGLTITEARQAVKLIQHDLVTEQYPTCSLFLHHSYNQKNEPLQDVLHFLPSYDEYLISYKDRSTVMEPEYHHKAFNTFGIFQPVILHNGHVIGNWKKVTKKKQLEIETEFFIKKNSVKADLIKTATENYKAFLL